MNNLEKFKQSFRKKFSYKYNYKSDSSYNGKKNLQIIMNATKIFCKNQKHLFRNRCF